MKKLQNYFTREVLHTTLGMMLIFLGIMISVMFVRYLSMAASGRMSIDNAMATLGITIPSFINLLIPICFFLSLVVTINRLLYDNEMATAFACGVSWFDLVKWMLIPGALLACLSLILSFWVVPKMAYYQNNLSQISSQNSSASSMLQSGRFFASGPNNQVVYIGAINPKNGASQEIFIYQKEGDTTKLTIAPKGTLGQKNDLSDVTLLNGHRYEGVIGSLAYQIVGFDSFNLLIVPTYNTTYSDKSTYPLSTLIKDHTPGNWLELEWRTAIPIETLVLSILGVMMGDSRPRKSKYLYFLIGTGLFIVYLNSLSIARSMVMNNDLPLLPGLFIVHFLFLLLGLFLLVKRELFLTSIFKKDKP